MTDAQRTCLTLRLSRVMGFIARWRSKCPGATSFLVLLIGLGVAARIRAYLGGRVLWVDEAMLALNVVQRPLAGLTRPLDWNQLAPWGFLFVSKAAILTLGVSEHTLRLIPFVAGLAAIPLMYRLARLCLASRDAALLATVLFALSPVAVYQSNEFKPYSTDVLWTLLILCMAVPLLRASLTKGKILALAVLGGLAIWTSYPSVFTLATVCTVLIIRAFASSNRRSLIAPMTLGAWYALNFVVSYRLALNPSTQAYMLRFWQSSFLPFPPRAFWDVVLGMDVLNGLFATVTAPEPFLNVDTGSALLACAVFVAGMVVLFRKDLAGFFLVTTPISLSIVACALRLYPIGGRVSLFIVPCLAITMSAGLTSDSKSSPRTLGAIAAALLLVFPLLSAVNTLARPPRRDEIGPVLGHISQHWQTGDRIFVNTLAGPAFMFYSRFNGSRKWADGDAIFARGPQQELRYLQQFEELRGMARVWVLFSHTSVHPEQVESMVTWLDQRGRRLDESTSVGAAAYLYDFRDWRTEGFRPLSFDGSR